MVKLKEVIKLKNVLDEMDVNALASRFESRRAESLLNWAIERYGSRMAIVTSFQSEGMAIIDMAYHINPDVRIITIDTQKLPKETHDLINRIGERYGINVEIHYPQKHVISEMVREHGANLFYDNVSLRMLCCHNRKVEPMNQALTGLNAWITGLRRSQSETRADFAKIQVDPNHGHILKLNPLADWTHEQVWQYIRSNQVPYNALYDKGYTSIGCDPCTRAIKPGEDLRAGRWWWEDGMPKECGIHIGPAWGRTK